MAKAEEMVGFGQRALETDEPRSATCTCSVDTEIISLNKEDYLTVLHPF